MPTVAFIAGMAIVLYPNDHPPPHFHVLAADFEARISIDDGTVIDCRGRMRPQTRHLLAEWTARHRSALMDNWHRVRRAEPTQRITE